MNLVSVIIPTFNRQNTISRAVESVRQQSYQPLEIIVIDDGSTDETVKILKSLIDGQQIKYLYQKNQGVSAARNQGIKIAQGRLIAFLDSDDFWLPEKCQKQVEYLKANPELLICQTQEKWLRNGRLVNPKQKHRKKSGDIFEASLRLCLISPSAVMIRPELLATVGVFDTRLTAAEDYDLWLWITAKFQAGLIDEPLIVKTGGHDDQLSSLPGLDKFRVWSLIKILLTVDLSLRQRQATREILAEKAGLYGQGGLKRGRLLEGEAYLKLAAKVLDNKTLVLEDLDSLISASGGRPQTR